jgi:hypothetical protein
MRTSFVRIVSRAPISFQSRASGLVHPKGWSSREPIQTRAGGSAFFVILFRGFGPEGVTTTQKLYRIITKSQGNFLLLNVKTAEWAERFFVWLLQLDKGYPVPAVIHLDDSVLPFADQSLALL